AILAVVSGTTNGRKNDKNTGGRWYDKTKWSNAARNPPPVVEGSGNTDIVSDLDETPRGLGPDDEDSETGSGAMEGPGSVEEGSGLSGIKFETSTGSAFDATHLTTSNVTNKLTNEPGVSTKILPSDSVTVAALFLTTTLAQRPVTQQEPVHSTHKVILDPKAENLKSVALLCTVCGR
uniref:Uncharacterized protein n=1 Tax=Romanomermis culicivorax TaxID=13658 RepID=A0A915KA06_ROMCU